MTNQIIDVAKDWKRKEKQPTKTNDEHDHLYIEHDVHNRWNRCKNKANKRLL